MANKEASVAELTESFRSSNAVLLTEYRGLTVAQLKSLRQSISEHATYAVVSPLRRPCVTSPRQTLFSS
jgi:large subunit ribosomal protein L10